jgi:mono/diheme cytochrome c family protein
MVLGLFALSFSACHLDMYDQPKNKAFTASDFFANKSSARPLIEDTVARDRLKVDARTTGREGGDPTAPYVTTNPITVDAAVLARGEARYKIYCASCHGEKGNGKGPAAGPISKGGLGLVVPALFYVDQLKGMAVPNETFTLDQAPDGYYFSAITHGVPNLKYDPSKPQTADNPKYTMFPAGYRIQNIDDRWAIIAYIREMQKNPPAKK